jgi:hypothetical protein
MRKLRRTASQTGDKLSETESSGFRLGIGPQLRGKFGSQEFMPGVQGKTRDQQPGPGRGPGRKFATASQQRELAEKADLERLKISSDGVNHARFLYGTTTVTL